MCVDLQGKTHTFRLLLLVFFFTKINKTTWSKNQVGFFLNQNFIFQFIYKKIQTKPYQTFL